MFAFSKHSLEDFSNPISHRLFKKASKLYQFDSNFFFRGWEYVSDTKLGIPALTDYFLSERKYNNGIWGVNNCFQVPFRSCFSS